MGYVIPWGTIVKEIGIYSKSTFFSPMLKVVSTNSNYKSFNIGQKKVLLIYEYQAMLVEMAHKRTPDRHAILYRGTHPKPHVALGVLSTPYAILGGAGALPAPTPHPPQPHPFRCHCPKHSILWQKCTGRQTVWILLFWL